MERMEKASKRMQELETVTNNIQLLSDMLNHYSADTATSSELDVMKVRERTGIKER
jgi:ADP-ribosylation factor-binding protein GGA